MKTELGTSSVGELSKLKRLIMQNDASRMMMIKVMSGRKTNQQAKGVIGEIADGRNHCTKSS